jgi:hypothetical protein
MSDEIVQEIPTIEDSPLAPVEDILVDAPLEHTDEPQPEPAEPKPAAPRLQKRIDKIVSEREQAKQEAEFWKQKALETLPLQQRAAPQPEPVQDLPPIYQNFASEEEYVIAQHAYLTNKIKQEVMQEITQKQAVSSQTNELTQLLQNFSAKSAEHAELLQSYSDIKITPDMADKLLMVKQLDNAEDVLYDLLLDEKRYADYFREPSQAKAALYLGRFSEQKKINSKLLPSSKIPPKPITTVSGAGGKPSVDLNSLSVSELKEYRAKYGYR